VIRDYDQVREAWNWEKNQDRISVESMYQRKCYEVEENMVMNFEETEKIWNEIPFLAMWIPHEDTNRCTRVKFLFRVNIGRVTFTTKDP